MPVDSFILFYFNVGLIHFNVGVFEIKLFIYFLKKLHHWAGLTSCRQYSSKHLSWRWQMRAV
jgi:hypothetical protein